MKKLIRKNKKGFTLIELIVVVAILAILAAIAVPNFIGMTDKARTATEVAAAAEWANAINIYNTLADEDKMIKGQDAGDLVTKPAVGTDLEPQTDVDNPETYVYPRIAVDANGIATVENKNNLH